MYGHSAGEEQAVMEGSPLSGGSYCNYKKLYLHLNEKYLC